MLLNESFLFRKSFFKPITFLFILFITLLFTNCSGPKILDYYEVTKKTPLYRHVTLSGSYGRSLAKGDTIIVDQIFSKAVLTTIDGNERYVNKKHVKKIEMPVEQQIVSETSEIPPGAQQFLLEYGNYWDWPFWVINIVLGVIIFLGYALGFRAQVSISIDRNIESPELEYFPIATFIIGSLLGIWHFILPETTEGVIYRLEFLMPPLGLSNTAWVVFVMFAVAIVLNIMLFIRMIRFSPKYMLFLYPYYTVLGAITFIFALYLATASIVIAIIIGVAFLALSYAGGLANSDFGSSGSRSSELSQEDEAMRRSLERTKRNQKNQAEWHQVYKGENRDPNTFN